MEQDGSSVGPAQAPPYVLVVDDEPATRKLHAKMLEASDYEVDVAGSAEAALELVRRRCPDAIVSDLMLNGLGGDELARRSLELCPDTRIVFVSGFEPSRLREAGITQVTYLPKPIPRGRLQSLLRDIPGR